MNNKPAILGNAPIFTTKVPIVRPVLPSFADLASDAEEMITTGMVTKGRHLLEFEQAVAEHLGVRHAVAVSSCTTGLMLTHKCLGLTGEVVMPSFTFMATASALVWAGLKPVFADVDFHTTNLDPAAAEAAITPDTSAIVAVHNFGNPADMDALESLADRKGLKLIYDAAHDDELAARVRIGREYGNSGRYDSAFPGINARLPEFNALMGVHSLRTLEKAACRRNEIASLYRETLGVLPGIGFQLAREGNRNSYKDFSVTVDGEAFGLGRDDLARALESENVDTRMYYDPPVHRQTAYAQFAPKGDPLHNTDLLAARSLSLPMWSEMTDETVLDICRAVARIHEFASDVVAVLEQSTTASAV